MSWALIGIARMRHTHGICTLTLILLNTTTPTFANSVFPDQMASEEAI